MNPKPTDGQSEEKYCRCGHPVSSHATAFMDVMGTKLNCYNCACKHFIKREEVIEPSKERAFKCSYCSPTCCVWPSKHQEEKAGGAGCKECWDNLSEASYSIIHHKDGSHSIGNPHKACECEQCKPAARPVVPEDKEWCLFSGLRNEQCKLADCPYHDKPAVQKNVDFGDILEWLKQHMKDEGYEKWDGSLSSHEIGHLISHCADELERYGKERYEVGRKDEKERLAYEGETAYEGGYIAALEEAILAVAFLPEDITPEKVESDKVLKGFEICRQLTFERLNRLKTPTKPKE